MYSAIRLVESWTFHPLFKEFQVGKIGDLLRQLEKLRPKGSKGEASIREESAHFPAAVDQLIGSQPRRWDAAKSARKWLERYNNRVDERILKERELRRLPTMETRC